MHENMKRQIDLQEKALLVMFPRASGFLLCSSRQTVEGFPTYPGRQVHLGWWRVTWQMALRPHDPGQGSAHLLLTHARFVGHSLLTRHSGLQFGGGPSSSGKHAQDDEEPSGVTVHLEFGPQGEGLHGSLGFGSSPVSSLGNNENHPLGGATSFATPLNQARTHETGNSKRTDFRCNDPDICIWDCDFSHRRGRSVRRLLRMGSGISRSCKPSSARSRN